MTKRIKSIKRLLIFIVLCLGFFGIGTGLYLNSLLKPLDASKSSQDMLIQVAPRSSSGQVARMLEQQGIIRSATAFRLYSRYHQLDNQIKAGYYLLNPSMSTPSVLNVLVRGKTATKAFTIPEGYNLQQITNTLVTKGFIKEEVFKNLLAEGQFNYPFLEDAPGGSKRLEGYLFPETYNIPLDSGEKEIINVMLAGMDRQLKELDYEKRASAMNLSVHEALTIASMIEREARKDEERPIISSVIHNRLGIGMRLQIDATVEYALGGHREKIYYKDLEVDSPYNTYKYNGLPPGPIAAPGRQSLLAAVAPDTTKYLYYVAKPDGSHAFATTLEEHNANKRKYLD
ncbi:endolytic transglycosylase MltG [Desulforamulus aquiferis]|uniref:Endolytic murein transglycosylase n=1 Tax=Desulforamulus aquiferis TaxID=1397668 RepID=A0AAW7ZHE7_9FIRM|nr:endolytic transglycosylase MltG [Desulforamulus aquiferis]MDO7788698.1 endolytic transglycosylase MltG [Desulforamulus aquiferis]RYD06471.1 hypothetical protein N752_03860 [Desulforamulus aquiferis]